MTIDERPQPRLEDTGDAAQRRSDFNKLWFGQAVAAMGSQVTTLALPLVAIIYLNASATQVGFLGGARELAILLLMLFFGVMVDRMRRRPLMIAADLGRAAVLLTIPVLAVLGMLGMPVLYVVAFLLGCLTVVFDLASRAYLPTLLGSDELLGGNSKLQATDSIADVAGPGVGGVLVQFLRAPFALIVTTASFLVSAVAVWMIRTPEPRPQREQDQNGQGAVREILADIGAGLRFTFTHKLLRPLAISAAVFNFFVTIQLTIFVVYAARSMELSAGHIGVVFGAFGVGGFLAATSIGFMLSRVGYGRLILLGYLIGILAIVSIPFVGGTPLMATALFTLAYAVAGYGIVGLNIAEITVRQIVTPDALQGRVNASFRFLIGALMPLAAAVSGVIGDLIGLRETLLITAAGVPIALLLLLFSKVKDVRELDGPGMGDESAAGHEGEEERT